MVQLRILGAPSLLDDDRRSIGSVLQQPRRLALVSYLALNASGTFLRRDRLLVLFWPHSAPHKARSSLSEALSRLRSSLGPDVIVTRGNDEVGLGEGTVWCDAVELRRAARAGDSSTVLELYGGPLLDGLVIEGLHELEQWIEATRAHLTRIALEAAGRLADEAIAERRDDGLALAERALGIDPLDGGAACRVMALLARDGHRAAALDVAEHFTERIRSERGVEPGRAVVELEDAIRADDRAAPVGGPSGTVDVDRPSAPPRRDGSGGDAEAPIDSRPLGPRRPTRDAPAVRAVMRTVAAAAVLALTFVVGAKLRPPSSPGAVLRYSFAFPTGEGLSTTVLRPRVALSPDGTHLLYVGGDEMEEPVLFLRSRSELNARRLPGTQRATNPFFSPDGSRFGYLRGPSPVQEIMLGSFNGEPPTILADTRVGLAGASWSSDGFIYYDGVTAGGTTGVVRVHHQGGALEQMTVVDTLAGETDHVWPTALPDGRGVLFTILREDGLAAADVAVLDLASGRVRTLVRAITARYAEPGFLLFVRSTGTLAAVPFDLERLSVSGTTLDVADGLTWRLNGATDLAVSASGTLVYVQGARAADPAELVWLDREGSVELVDPEWRGDFSTLDLAPDGRHVAMSLLPATWFHVQEIHVRNLGSGRTVKLTDHGPSQNFKPVWLPDGRTVAFLSDRGGNLDIYRQRIDQPHGAELMLDTEESIVDFAMDSGGQWIAYVHGGDIFALPMGEEGEGEGQPIVATAAEESSPALSPDGRWIAYTSDQSGQPEVYVASFPESHAAREVVSSAGGTGATWAHSGKEIFYEAPDGSFRVVTVEVAGDGTLRSGEATSIPHPRARWRWPRGRSFDLSPDDRRILTTVADTAIGGDELIVNDGLPELLRRLGGR